ncbi:unnamed protein product [Spodoptera littoralis]|uniref:Uncharacterized protein n=1 Tax=Spodoptera littoralis TaxID=7109 RepID=A0A9P0N713_SPOLI|nr:unnamed protein product [Spodoptera littoralis]CAH1647410.1 unnamed protein product [Spodoptera littoralis]
MVCCVLDELPLMRHICVQAVPDSVAISEGKTLILNFEFITFYPLRDLRMEWRIGTVTLQRTTFSQKGQLTTAKLVIRKTQPKMTGKVFGFLSVRTETSFDLLAIVQSSCVVYEYKNKSSRFNKILNNLNRLKQEKELNKLIISVNKWAYFIRIKIHGNVIYSQKPDSNLRNRLLLKSIVPARRPGTPSWAQYFNSIKCKQKVKRCTKPYRNIYDIDIYMSSEESTSSSTSQPHYSPLIRPEIRQIRRLLPPIPRNLPHRQVSRRVINMPLPSRWSHLESVQPILRLRSLPVPVRTLPYPHRLNGYLRREVTPQAGLRCQRQNDGLNVPDPPRRYPVCQESTYRTHRRLIPPVPPRRQLLPQFNRTNPGLDRPNSREVLSQAIVSRPQNYNNEYHQPTVLRLCQYKPDHLQLTPTERRLVTPPSNLGLQCFGVKFYSSLTPIVHMSSTSSTPSTVLCRSPPITKTLVLEEKNDDYLYHRPYREKNEFESPTKKNMIELKSPPISPPSLIIEQEGGENFCGLFEDLEEPIKVMPPSSSKWVPPTWAEGLSPSPDVEIESFQETVDNEGQASVVSTKTAPLEELKAVDSVITFTTKNAIHIITIAEENHDGQLPITYAIPVRPRSLPRRILARCIKMFRFSRLLARDQAAPVIDV